MIWLKINDGGLLFLNWDVEISTSGWNVEPGKNETQEYIKIKWSWMHRGWMPHSFFKNTVDLRILEQHYSRFEDVRTALFIEPNSDIYITQPTILNFNLFLNNKSKVNIFVKFAFQVGTDWNIITTCDQNANCQGCRIQVICNCERLA